MTTGFNKNQSNISARWRLYCSSRGRWKSEEKAKHFPVGVTHSPTLGHLNLNILSVHDIQVEYSELQMCTPPNVAGVWRLWSDRQIQFFLVVSNHLFQCMLPDLKLLDKAIWCSGLQWTMQYIEQLKFLRVVCAFCKTSKHPKSWLGALMQVWASG